MDIPHFRVSKTLWLKNTTPKRELPEAVLEKMSEKQRKHVLQIVEHLGPNEEILNLYNVAIQRDWFASFNLMKSGIKDGIYEGMDPIEAFNRRNNNAIKSIIVGLLYNHRAEEVEYGCLKFVSGKPSINKIKIASIKDLNHLEDPGNEKIEYYWVIFRSCPEWFESKKVDEDVSKGSLYKITMFHKDFDWNSGNLHVLPGAMQIWERTENNSLLKISGKNVISPKERKIPTGKTSTGEIFIEEGWTPIPFSEKRNERYSNNLYMYWHSNPDIDIWKHIGCVLGKEDFEALRVDPRCRAAAKDASKEFYSVLNGHPFLNLGLARGTGTYYFLQFSKKDNPDDTLITGYRIIYVENEGYFYDFDGKLHEYQKGNIICNDDSVVAESPNDYNEQWKLKYDEG